MRETILLRCHDLLVRIMDAPIQRMPPARSSSMAAHHDSRRRDKRKLTRTGDGACGKTCLYVPPLSHPSHLSTPSFCSPPHTQPVLSRAHLRAARYCTPLAPPSARFIRSACEVDTRVLGRRHSWQLRAAVTARVQRWTRQDIIPWGGAALSMSSSIRCKRARFRLYCRSMRSTHRVKRAWNRKVVVIMATASLLPFIHAVPPTTPSSVSTPPPPNSRSETPLAFNHPSRQIPRSGPPPSSHVPTSPPVSSPPNNNKLTYPG
jgi:hypothetical protein